MPTVQADGARSALSTYESKVTVPPLIGTFTAMTIATGTGTSADSRDQLTVTPAVAASAEGGGAATLSPTGPDLKLGAKLGEKATAPAKSDSRWTPDPQSETNQQPPREEKPVKVHPVSY